MIEIIFDNDTLKQISNDLNCLGIKIKYDILSINLISNINKNSWIYDTDTDTYPTINNNSWIYDTDTDTDPNFYYSSILFDKNILKKKFVWGSTEFKQSILHPFEQIRDNEGELTIEPCIYQFEINNNFFLLNSNNELNKDIFNDLLPAELFKEIIKYYKHNDNTIDILFSGEKNSRILQILEILQKYSFFKIYGYRNKYDQIETAFINFEKVCILNSLKKSKIKSIKILGEFIINFPLNIEEYKIQVQTINGEEETGMGLSSYGPNIKLHYTMSCHLIKEISYEDFDNQQNIKTFKCENTKYYQKYLKYKKKYLLLKKNIY